MNEGMSGESGMRDFGRIPNSHGAIKSKSASGGSPGFSFGTRDVIERAHG